MIVKRPVEPFVHEIPASVYGTPSVRSNKNRSKAAITNVKPSGVNESVAASFGFPKSNNSFVLNKPKAPEPTPKP